MKEAKYWSCNEDEEMLTATDPDEAVREFVDDAVELPNKIEVFGFAPMAVDWDDEGDTALTNMIERIDEEFGNPEEKTEITEGMKAAAKEFSDKISKLYHVFACEHISVDTIDMAEWLKENDPERIKDIKNAAPKSEESTAQQTTAQGEKAAQA
jgi:uncharacterized protein YqcC (DUF446 family)